MQYLKLAFYGQEIIVSLKYRNMLRNGWTTLLKILQKSSLRNLAMSFLSYYIIVTAGLS